MGRLELIPLIKTAFVGRCQGHAAVFKEKSGSERPSPAGPPGGSISWSGCQQPPPPAAPHPGPAADACPLPDRALASVLLPRVVVIYILSVYINLSAAALAALLQSACLLCSLGDFPHRRPGAACRGAGGGEPGPPGSCALRSNNKRLWRGRPRRLVPDLGRGREGPGWKRNT
ncbi:unnamed protein product [Rangifer tarandus platyrhynchus]|uniref:Uncharacterized protein n=2 Tax=Rangifer tarandus platyrhynchus TaxID=3082113 RepID=A0ACB0EN98_RANTA|nr:unnamed protein product [Rangifer tarandus platyrhynchus]CAI9702197.1 unnamed protein product [Rangifer tarandus platyrhynchus]